MSPFWCSRDIIGAPWIKICQSIFNRMHLKATELRTLTVHIPAKLLKLTKISSDVFHGSWKNIIALQMLFLSMLTRKAGYFLINTLIIYLCALSCSHSLITSIFHLPRHDFLFWSLLAYSKILPSVSFEVRFYMISRDRA